MAEMESVNLRVESGLRDRVAKIARQVEGDTRPSDLSTTAQKLIYVGLALRKSGIEPEFEGPLGVIPRPFATIEFGGETVTFGTQLSTSVLDELTAAFSEQKHPSAREALRLGVIALELDDLTVTGPLGGSRPFANVTLSEHIEDERGRNAIEELLPYLSATNDRGS